MISKHRTAIHQHVQDDSKSPVWNPENKVTTNAKAVYGDFTSLNLQLHCTWRMIHEPSLNNAHLRMFVDRNGFTVFENFKEIDLARTYEQLKALMPRTMRNDHRILLGKVF
jgi:hypothetical protein